MKQLLYSARLSHGIITVFNVRVLYSIYCAASSSVSIFVGSLGLLCLRSSILTKAAIHSPLLCLFSYLQRTIFFKANGTWEIRTSWSLTATETFVMWTDILI